MKPKLTNPTDSELNAAFAEKVAGWVWTKIRDEKYINGELFEAALFVWCHPNGAFAGNSWQHKFSQSADAVLPWLEAKPIDSGFYGWSLRFMPASGLVPATYYVTVGVTTPPFYGEAQSFPRAAVIALLRAHGVEVEFS